MLKLFYAIQDSKVLKLKFINTSDFWLLNVFQSSF